MKKASSFNRSICPVACTLNIVGDKWTLLVIRDLLVGKKTYSEFQKSPESIPTNILANRLKRLLEYEIIKKVAYQQNPIRYEYILTAEGKELVSVIEAMVHWGEGNISGSQALLGSNKV